jgi:hypothetical protein
MKKIALFLIIALAATAADSDKAAPQMPDEVTLTSGRVLRHVEVVRWEKDRVVLDYSGGVDPVPFSMITSVSMDDLVAMRDQALHAKKVADKEQERKAAREREIEHNPALAKPEEQTQYHGQMFIVTKGAGNYKMGGVTVYVLPASTWDDLQSIVEPVYLPKPLAAPVSDSDGKFQFSLPKGMPFILLAQGKRLAWNVEEKYEWCVKSQDLSTPEILLSNNNHRDWLRTYRFSE